MLTTLSPLLRAHNRSSLHSSTWNQADRDRIHEALDHVIKHCQTDGVPEWQEEFERRSDPRPTRIPSDIGVMKHFCIAIAYSQGSQSRIIGKLIDTHQFKEAFHGFDFHALAKANPENILDEFWSVLKSMRFRSKVEKIVQCARILGDIAREHGSFAKFLNGYKIPRRLKTSQDIDTFWTAFEDLRKDLLRRGMPFFRHTTSLLQLLLDLNHDAIKPDLIIMRLCYRLGITQKETGDKHFRHAVRFLQEYAVKRKLSANALDWALLAFGGQTGAGSLLQFNYCEPSSICTNDRCQVGARGLCLAYN
jgi:hypothetical protein